VNQHIYQIHHFNKSPKELLRQLKILIQLIKKYLYLPLVT
jgi:hypothetical protein